MSARRTSTAAKTSRALKAVPNDEQPAATPKPRARRATEPRASNGTPTKATKATAHKPATDRKPAASADKLSTDTYRDESTPLPTDGTQLRELRKIASDRRWRAGKRDDTDLVADMNVLLVRIQQALKGQQPDTPAESKPAAKVVSARKTTSAARKSTPARKR